MALQFLTRSRSVADSSSPSSHGSRKCDSGGQRVHTAVMVSDIGDGECDEQGFGGHGAANDRCQRGDSGDTLGRDGPDVNDPINRGYSLPDAPSPSPSLWDQAGGLAVHFGFGTFFDSESSSYLVECQR